jgi:hypothetical protein
MRGKAAALSERRRGSFWPIATCGYETAVGRFGATDMAELAVGSALSRMTQLGSEVCIAAVVIMLIFAAGEDGAAPTQQKAPNDAGALNFMRRV